ncbi:hypothetical protein E5163_15875 [Marinicauda algicola]|uniref:Uncharacterized protein n=1 Tax=Marinicauda algicola TaxID=2029849 RepID=A0A4S2GWE2_9PROT|nr:hypothetical protein [Marinicauda algicola]TGY87198.1 hypothetical protein E5163_15875 [Marinicauda algicola]
MRTIAAILSLSLLAGCETVGEALSEDEPNPGPCPTALSLYDAHRIVEFKGEELTYANVGFTGEILNVVRFCEYTDARATPIELDLGIRMAFGRGPAAEGRTHTYHYFVAVTRKDMVVIDREVYPITVTFPPGEDRVEIVQEFEGIEIPRANETLAGTNFEIIVGFELTEEQLAFNRSGMRFRVTAGQES